MKFVFEYAIWSEIEAGSNQGCLSSISYVIISRRVKLTSQVSLELVIACFLIHTFLEPVGQNKRTQSLTINVSYGRGFHKSSIKYTPIHRYDISLYNVVSKTWYPNCSTQVLTDTSYQNWCGNY